MDELEPFRAELTRQINELGHNTLYGMMQAMKWCSVGDVIARRPKFASAYNALQIALSYADPKEGAAQAILWKLSN